MNILQKLSLFIIYLIISLPFVFAQQLEVITYSGKDGANGSMRTIDDIRVIVNAHIPGEDIIDTEQLRLYIEESYAFFDNCEETDETGTYLCTFSDEFETYDPIPFKIELRDDDQRVVAQDHFTITPDNQPPQVKLFTIDPELSNGDIIASFRAEDYGLTYDDPSSCSGIKKISITAGTDEIYSAEGELGLCALEDIVSATVPNAGTQNVCMTVTDYVNRQSAPSCVSVIVDKAPPVITDFVILDQGNFPLTHVHSGEERAATVNVRILDDGGLESVAANFFQLNPSLPDFFPPDITTGVLYSWTNIPVSEATNCKVRMQATDVLGNFAQKEFNCDVKADDTSPTIKDIVPHAEKEGVPLYGYNTAIVIQLEDRDNTGGAGIGFNARKVYLDMDSLGMGDKVPAEQCTRVSGALWQCSWAVVPSSTTDEGTYTVAITADSADDLDNTVNQRASFDIVYDNVGPHPPEIIEFKVGDQQTGLEYQAGGVRGNYVQFTVRSADFATATADFSEIGGSAQTPATTCKSAGDKKDCIFESLIQLSGPYTAHLTFTFADEAQNTAETETAFEVYGIDNEAQPRYWNSEPAVTCSPRLVDRATSLITPARVSCRIDLQTPRADISTLTVVAPTSPDQCTGDVAGNLNDVYVINNDEDSSHPYLMYILEPKTYDINSLNINCPIQVFSKRKVVTSESTQYFVSPVPQQIEVNTTLQFYNQPLADVYSNIDRQIEKAMDNALSNADWIGELQKYLHYVEVACKLKVILGNLFGALYVLTGALGAASQALAELPPAQAALEEAKKGVCHVEEKSEKAYTETDKLLSFLDSLCAIANCQLAEGGKDVLGVKGLKGGYAPYCDKIQDYFSKTYGSDFQNAMKKYNVQPFDIKDSLILSTVCLCLPGIVYNVEKMRQVNCFKAVCLNDYVKEQGYPTSLCNDMTNYFTCALVIGEIFALIPFSAFFEDLIQKSINIITDPVAAFTMALGGVCDSTCDSQGPYAFLGCAALKTFTIIGEAVGAYKQYFDTKGGFKPVGQQYCQRMEEIKDELNQ